MGSHIQELRSGPSVEKEKTLTPCFEVYINLSSQFLLLWLNAKNALLRSLSLNDMMSMMQCNTFFKINNDGILHLAEIGVWAITELYVQTCWMSVIHVKMRPRGTSQVENVDHVRHLQGWCMRNGKGTTHLWSKCYLLEMIKCDPGAQNQS